MRRVAALVTIALASLAGLLAARGAHAAPLLAPSPALTAKAAAYERQESVFSTRENGLFLDPIVNPPDVPLVQAFFAQTAEPDFQKQSGRAPFSVLAEYDEHGDEGNFAGIATVGIAARLIWLRANGASAADVTRARDAAVRAARAWHVYGTIGGPGVVARGVRRIKAEQPSETLPGTLPTLVPLKDGGGSALPKDKEPVWRAPIAPGFSDWIWFDDTSKDQVSGYALAVAWLWDALHDDPDAPKDLAALLAADLALFVKRLMEVAPETGVDLCLRDADGRLTSFFDLNPRNLGPGPALPESSTLRNGFNAALALGIVRAAYHASGSEEIGRWYYEELVGRRDLPAQMAENAGLLFIGPATNFSNANMLAIALATLGRVETDPYVRSRLDETLQKHFWSTGDSRDAKHVGQAWFDAIYGAYASAPEAGLGARIEASLLGLPDVPALERDRTNCDAQEITAGSCLAIDGKTTITLAKERGHGGLVVADAVVPATLRPDSDFEWRSDPFRVNGGPSTRMMPGGDFLAAYWLARTSDTSTAKNLSPAARPALPYTRLADAGTGGGGDAPSSGCDCVVGAGGAGGAGPIALGLVLVACLARRRRAR